MSQYGSLIHASSKNLLSRSNQLLESLGQLGTLIDGEEEDIDHVSWAEYKRDQRSNALREFWEKVRRRKELLKLVGQSSSKSGASASGLEPGSTAFVTSFLEPFSSKGNSEREYRLKLEEIRKCGFAYLLPWHQIISSELADGKTRIDDLSPVIGDSRKDRAFKFQTIVRMAHDGSVKLDQEETFSPINISKQDEFRTGVKLRTSDGEEFERDWRDFSENQRKKVIDDLKDGKIVLT